MRLIYCRDCTPDSRTSLRLENFIAGNVPKEYAILSHTWKEDERQAEVTLQDFKRHKKSRRNSRSWKKIQSACHEAKRHNLDYIWIDNCCIDRTNPAELQEAINSMYRWYSESAVCLVYLSDWEEKDLHDDVTECRWFSRGWTLQELVAPCSVQFYNDEWDYLGNKKAYHEILARITGIDKKLLQADTTRDIRDQLLQIPICQKMSWASNRKTTILEDEAYCLLGIFDIQMPLLYGEGENAFRRLQETIAHTTNDYTLFAWKLQKGIEAKHNPRNFMRLDPASKPSDGSETHNYHGIFACSPREFALSGRVQSSVNAQIYNPEFSITNKGLKISVPVFGSPFETQLLPLNCIEVGELPGEAAQPVAVSLRWLGGDVYARSDIHDLPKVVGNHHCESQDEVYLPLSLNHLRLSSGMFHRSSIRLPDLSKAESGMVLRKASPGRFWDEKERLFATFGHSSPFGCAAYQVPGFDKTTFMVFFGLDPSDGRPWFCLADPSSDLKPSEHERRREFLVRVKIPAQKSQTDQIQFSVQGLWLSVSYTIKGHFEDETYDQLPIHDLILSVEQPRPQRQTTEPPFSHAGMLPPNFKRGSDHPPITNAMDFGLRERSMAIHAGLQVQVLPSPLPPATPGRRPVFFTPPGPHPPPAPAAM